MSIFLLLSVLMMKQKLMIHLLYLMVNRIDPFRGSYNVAVSVNQFYTIREAIRSMTQMDQGNDKENINGDTTKNLSESEIIDALPGDGTLWL